MSAKPPVNTKNSAPLQGINISRIDFYQIGDKVSKLRSSGATLQEITDEINQKYLPADAVPINAMTCSRWIKKNLSASDNVDQRQSEDYSCNEHQELLDMLQFINNQLEIAEGLLSDIRKEAKEKKVTNGKEVRDVLFILEKLTARKQSILASLTEVKAKIYSFSNLNEIIRIALDIVKTKDMLLYADVIEEIKKNPSLVEAYRKIRPEK